MNSFTSANNWFKLPSGYIVQFFSASFDTSGSYINFPTPFASRVVAVIPGTFMNSNTSNVVQFSSIALDTLSL
ncbi:phage tail protein, partial [Escherichia coli]|nr:phage tail protein [Escherichia coli]